MKRLALLGVALSLVMALAVIVPGYAAPPTTIPPVSTHRPSRPLMAGMMLSITGSGTAYEIRNQTIQQTASLSLTVKVDRAAFGGAILTVTGGSLTIGSDTWTVDSGRGMLNFHSGRMVLKVSVKNSSGATGHLVLFGKVTADLTSAINVGTSINVNFLHHQSKLASKWFLAFPGATVTRTS
jgi:hypothetical protein